MKELIKHERLGKYVNDRFIENFTAKKNNGEYQREQDCVAVMRGDVLTCASHVDNSPNLTLNIATPTVKAIAAMLKKPLSKAAGQPYTIKPSPIPELSESAKADVMRGVEQSIQSLLSQGEQLDIQMLESLKNKLVESAKLSEQTTAYRNAEKLQKRVYDVLTEGGFENAISQFITDITEFPIAILKVENHAKRKINWDGESAKVDVSVSKQLINIRPVDYYPAPYARGDDTDGAVIEVRNISASQLNDMSESDGWAKMAIDRVIELHRNGYHHADSTSSYGSGNRQLGGYGLYTALIMHDRVHRQMIEDIVTDLPTDTFIDIEVWSIAGIAIRAVINPHPTGQRPYFVSSFSKRFGTLYGSCPASDVIVLQKIINSLTTNLVRNMAYSSGIQGEVDIERLGLGATDEAADDWNIITPNQIRPVTTDHAHGQPAYRFYQLPNLSGDIVALIDKFNSYIYTVIGMPAYAFGDTSTMGGVGRTSGGVAMMMTQANNPLFSALENIEKDVIVPLVNELILDEMLNGEDRSIIGDINVYAGGMSSIIDKEARSERLVWLMQSLTGIMGVTDESGKPIINPEAPARLLYRQFKDAGVPTAGLFPDFDMLDAAYDDVSESSAPIPVAETDGRTGDMASGIIDGAV